MPKSPNDPALPARLLYTRAQTAHALSCSVSAVKRLEQKGALAIIRFAESPHGVVHHSVEEVEALASTRRWA